MEWLELAIGGALLAASVVATLFDADAWPFTSYRMFAKPVTPQRLRVARLAIIDSQGRCRWWQPHYYKLQEYFGKELLRRRQVTAASSHHLRSVITHCVTNDNGCDAAYVVVILRRVEWDQRLGWQIINKPSARWPVASERLK